MREGLIPQSTIFFALLVLFKCILARIRNDPFYTAWLIPKGDRVYEARGWPRTKLPFSSGSGFAAAGSASESDVSIERRDSCLYGGHSEDPGEGGGEFDAEPFSGSPGLTHEEPAARIDALPYSFQRPDPAFAT
jgi:hypothetical protein